MDLQSSLEQIPKDKLESNNIIIDYNNQFIEFNLIKNISTLNENIQASVRSLYLTAQKFYGSGIHEKYEWPNKYIPCSLFFISFVIRTSRRINIYTKSLAKDIDNILIGQAPIVIASVLHEYSESFYNGKIKYVVAKKTGNKYICNARVIFNYKVQVQIKDIDLAERMKFILE